MPHIVGIDEVGYGPHLGPFVVCAVAAEVPTPEIDLWKYLRRTRIKVCDSKRIFSQAKGIGTIEPTALAYLAQLMPLEGLTHGRLWERISPDPRQAPWYGDLELPCETQRIPTEKLRLALASSGLAIKGVWARILDATTYNARVGKNKADLNFECAADLVKRALASFDGPADFYIGRHGGRKFYLPHIVKHFGMAMVREEDAGRSTYEFPRGRLSFLTDGEDRHFLIALASILGKYVREASMRLFNEYWCARVSGLKSTAGYGADGTRFFREIRPHLKACALREEDVFRKR